MAIVSPLLPAISALGISADRAASRLCDLIVPVDQRRFLRPKIRGQLRTALWTEGMRVWVQTVPVPAKVFDPYSWTELLVQGGVHLRLETEGAPAVSPRRAKRRQQLPDQQLPMEFTASGPVMNLDVVAHFSEATGSLSLLTLEARLGSSCAFQPVMLGLQPGRRQLQSWQRRRDEAVPWLEAMRRIERLGRSGIEVLSVDGSTEAVLDRLRDVTGIPPKPELGRRRARGTGSEG